MIRRYSSQKGYNWSFDTETGVFARWGDSIEDDPSYSPVGPEILDIEVSTICHGVNNKPCPFCYKANTGVGENMSLELFKKIFHKIPSNLTQIAFGIGDIDSNPDLLDMFSYCRNNGGNYVVPNVTVNGWNIDDVWAKKLASICGAVAVSRYDPKDVCYDAVQRLSNAGLEQVNIHQVLAQETMGSCYDLIKDVKTDKRLAGLRSVVFLLYKPKGRGKKNQFTPVTNISAYRELMQCALDNNISIGMDSCSSPLVMKSIVENGKVDPQSIEPCESLLFSMYINVRGELFPCSFIEGETDCERGIPVATCDNFLKDVWFSRLANGWRKCLLSSTDKCKGMCGFADMCRACPVFDITPCKK